MITLIDTGLLDSVSAEARANPRQRRNRNFHGADDFPCHRLLNAIEPGSYVTPHRHLAGDKDETMVVIRGRLGLVTFADDGQPLEKVLLGPATSRSGVDIAHGTWHTVFALDRGTVFFEAKAGPYLPLTPAELAPWAPPEGAPEASDYLAQLVKLVEPG
ncbi:MAG: WbuC family cupin fold metalloprotein [Betaproteobacteria bacterium]|nr:WbuC family cupin fold metalloprotein [Betaproteobacteria bacterium]